MSDHDDAPGQATCDVLESRGQRHAIVIEASQRPMTAMPGLTLVGVLLGSALVVGCNSIDRVVPGADSREVAEAYLEAIVAGDCRSGDAGHACLRRHSADRCGAGRALSATIDGDGTHPDPEESIYYFGMVVADVTGLEDGPTGLFIQVLRQPNGEWRLNSIGSGP